MYSFYYFSIYTILFNFIVSGFTIYIAKNMVSYKNRKKKVMRYISEASIANKNSFANDTNQKSWIAYNLELEKDLVTFSYSMLYYPLCQAITRSGNIWYESVYGVDFSLRPGSKVELVVSTSYTSIPAISLLTKFIIIRIVVYTCSNFDTYAFLLLLVYIYSHATWFLRAINRIIDL